MEVNEQLVRAVTQAVVAQLMASGAQPQNVSSTPAPAVHWRKFFAISVQESRKKV